MGPGDPAGRSADSARDISLYLPSRRSH